MTAFSMLGLSASAAAPQAGDLIKMDGLSSVYYLGNDGKRYVYPSESVYFSWHKDFSGVVTVSASELQSYPLGSNIVMRPGTKLIKITTDPSVYAVEPNGVLRKIQSEADAIAMFGANWAKRVVDVADAFFTNYTIGTPLAANEVPAGTLVKTADSGTIYYYDGANYRSIANEAAFNANRFDFANVVTVSSAITAGGSAISTSEFAYVPQSKTTGPVVTGSGLTASLSAATPAAAYVPQNGSRVPMAKVNLTAANDGAVTVNSITVKRIGLSSATNVTKVWAEQNGVIVASKKSMNSNDESILTFSPALTISAGQTVTLELLAELNGAGAGNIGLSIASASAVSATAAAISGSFPINGNLMTPTNYTVTEVLLNAGVSSASNVNIGDENVQLGKFDVAYSSNTRDIVLKSVMFRNTGDEDLAKVLMNVYLENNGKNVATGVISGKYITFTFNNGGLTMLKDDGDQRFIIKGDVIAKENSTNTNNIVLSLNKVEELVANEAANGFGVSVHASSTAPTLYVSQLVINAGVVSISKKSNSPVDGTYIKGTKGIVALLANVKADEAINAEGLNVIVDQTNTNSFENVKVYLNNVLLDSFDPTATGTKLIDSTLSLNKGDNEIKVTVDVKSNATTTAADFKVNLNTTASLLDSPEYSLTGNSVDSNDITGTVAGAKITVGGASFSAIRSDGYGSRNVVVGTSNISLGKITVKASNDTVKITNIAVASTSGNTIPSANLYDMKIFVDGSQVGTTRNFTSTGAAFSSLSIYVADNQTKTIELFGSIDSAATGSIVTKMIFTAEDSLGKTVTVTDEPTTAVATVVGSGSLAVAKDGDSPVGGILASKAGVEQTVAQFKLTATNDSANLTELVIDNSGATTTDPRIASYKLYVEGNSSAIDTMVPFGGEAKFVINNNAIIVPADGSKKITIKAVLNDINNDETATDAELAVRVKSLKFKSSNGDETPMASVNVAANTFRIRKTVPTVALLALPNTTLTSGAPVVAKFTVNADANADVKVGRIAVKYTATASTTLTTSTSPVKINGVSKNTNVTSSLETSGSDKYIVVDFGTSTPEIVSAGTSKTFEVVVNATVEGSNRESLSTSIVETGYSAGGATLVNYAFTWSDSASNTDSKNKWFNSWRVNGLPTDTQTMTTN